MIARCRRSQYQRDALASGSVTESVPRAPIRVRDGYRNMTVWADASGDAYRLLARRVSNNRHPTTVNRQPVLAFGWGAFGLSWL